MHLLDVERRLERIERLLRAAADEARSARTDIAAGRGPGDRWARMMLAVLDDLDREGGHVSRQRFLEIGEAHGYRNQGMAGFYQQLVAPGPDHTTRLTPIGRRRLESLRARFGANGVL